MTRKQDIVSFFTSLLVAIIPLLILETSLRNAVVSLTDFLQEVIAWIVRGQDSEKNKGIFIAVLFVLHTLLYLVFYILVFELLISLYLLLFTKMRKPVVFISYKISEPGTKVNTLALARKLKRFLEGEGFGVQMLQPKKKARHDVINQQVKQLLKDADVLLAIPDEVRYSYACAEIAAAYHMDKPVYIIKYSPGQALPATANSGHIVFNLEGLQANKFEPLKEVLPFIHGHWKTRLNILQLPFEKLNFGDKFPFNALGFYALAMLLALLVGLGVNIRVDLVKIAIEILMTILGFIMALATMKAIFKNLNLKQAASQSAINDKPTYAFLSEAGFTASTMASIEEKGLKPNYTIPGKAG